MSQVMMLCNDDDAVECDDCDWTGKGTDLDLISDFEERVSSGEIVPAGQCPKCGSLAHLATPPDWGCEAERDKAKASLKALSDALGTEETGDALIGVARNAHMAEQRLAALDLAARERRYPDATAALRALAEHEG